MTMIYGAQFSFSVFLKPLSEEFGWTRAATSGALATALWVSGLLGIFMGALTDRYGPKVVIIIGGFLGGLGYLFISYMSTLWQLYAAFGVMIAASTGAAWTPITATVSRWFTEKRVLALGIVTAGIGVGQMLIPPLAAQLIEGYGWRPAYTIIAVMVWVIVISVAMLARRSPQDMGLLPDGKTAVSNITTGKHESAEAVETKQWSSPEAMRTPAFWLLAAINAVIAATLYIVGIHIAAHATDIGISATSAALILTFMGGANILSKLVGGGLAAKIGSRATLFIFLAIEAVALFSLAGIRDLSMFFALAALFGFGFGGSAPPLAAMVAEFFGVRSVGLIMGLIGVGWATGCAIGTVLGDYIFDISGSYDMAFLGAGVVTVIGAVFTLVMRAPKH
jgi:MFS family permease